MNPSTGTFISMDSYQGSIYDQVSLHKYLYANANPVMYTDPSGYSSAPEAVAYMDGMSSLAAVEAYYNMAIINIGMKLIAQLRAVSAVESAVNLSTQTIMEICMEDAFSGTSNANKISAELLVKAIDMITLAYLMADDCIALDVVASSVEIAKAEVEAKAIPLDRNKEYKGYSVYLLRDSKNNNKVSYVGITNDPVRRANEHANDKRKRTKGKAWTMYVITSELTKEEARALEQSLICVYTIDALANARYEIAQKNYDNFELEFHRASELIKIPLDDLKSLMDRTKK